MSGSLPSEKSLVVNSVISEFSLNDFTEQQQIGSGGQAIVVRGYNDRLGNVAIKRLYRHVDKTEMRETILLAKLSNHQNIIHLYGLLTPEEGYSPNNRSFCIGYIMEYMENGSLYNVIHNPSVKYDMKQVYSWIEKASSGLQYLHEEDVLHRNIAPQNILLGKSLDDLKISGFGLAKAVEQQTIDSHTYGIGTVDYMAPELHNGTKYGKPADIYSLTITFWEIIHRERPFGYMEEIPEYKLIGRILNGKRPNVRKKLDISALLIRGWHSNPESRPKISEFIEFARKKRPAINLSNRNAWHEDQTLIGFDIPEHAESEFTKSGLTDYGGFASVHEAYHNKYGNVALKMNRKVFDNIKEELQEVRLLIKYSRHPNIVQVFGLLVNGIGDNKRYAGYIMEFMEHGSLYKVIHDASKEYDMKQVYSWIEKASSGLQYLHEEGVLHRDIKPQNILLGKSLDDLRISDFGVAKAVELQISHIGRIGTIDYMAPELLIETKYGKSADIYALTITFWEIIHREKPYGYMGAIPEYKLIGRILNGERPNVRKKLDISALLIRGWDSNPESRPKISEFIEFARKERPAQENLRKVERQSGGQQNTSVLILGGNGPPNAIYFLDLKAQSWKKLNITLPMGMQNFGAVVLNEKIYIFGGYSVDAYQQGCYKLKDDGSWIKLASLNQKRSDISSSSLVYKGDIWVIGGYSENSLKSVEKYDISEDKWIYMPEMNYARFHAAAAVFKDRIFVTGGSNGKNLKSVEMFDPKLQKWIIFCDLPFEVSGHTMLSGNSILSIFGGESNACPLNSVWEMDIEDPKKKWTKKQSFKHPRIYFGIGKLSNGIIVFGDATSEIFYENEWIDGPKLPQDLSDFAYTFIPRSLEEIFLKRFS